MLPLLMVGAAGLGTASADGKFTHSADIKVDAKLTERSRPIEKRDVPAGPTVKASDVLASQLVAADVRQEQIDLLEQDLIPHTPDTDVDEKAQLYFQLGDLYAKLHQLQKLKATETELALAKAGSAQKPALAAQLEGYKGKAHKALLGALRTYKTLTEEPRYASYPKMDVALFYFGYTLQGANYPKEARDAFDRLLKNYPKSKYVPDAHFAFAEAYFEAKQLADAEARYKKVLEFPSSSVYQFAKYKLGWVALNLGKPGDALEAFFQVAQATNNDPKRAMLNRAAKTDFVRAYAEIGRADKALPAFARVDAARKHDMLATLGDLYLDQGKVDKAIFVFRQLMTEQPTSKQVCLWQHSIARAMLTVPAADADTKVKEIEGLVKLYGALRDRKTFPKAELAECRDAAAEMSGQLARAYHQEGYKTKNAELLGRAHRLYRAYLGKFQDAPDYAETQYFAAELGWIYAELETKPRIAVEKWEDTARAFEDVVKNPKLSPRLVQVSADAAMLAWMKALAVDARPRAQSFDDEAAYTKIPTPRPLPEREQHLVAAFDLYLKYVKDPDDSERIDVTFHKANVLRRYDHLEEAIPLYDDIVKHHPDHETAGWSAQLVLDSYNRLQKYDAMLAYANALTKPFLAKHTEVDDTRKRLGRQAAINSAKLAEAEARRTKTIAGFIACGEKFLEAYNLEPLADNADEALYSAGVCYEEGKSISVAKRAYELLQQYFPKSKLTARSVARLGNVLGSIAYYKEAADKLEEYAAKYAGEQDAFGALSDAVQFRKGIGDDAKAIADTQLFVTKFGKQKPKEAANAYFSLVAIYEKQGDLDALAKHLRSYIDRYGATGGNDKLVTAWSKLGQTLWQASCPVKTVDGACVKIVRSVAIGKRLRTRAMGVPKRCGDENRAELTVVARDERKVKTAMDAFDRAIALYDKAAGKLDGDARGALYHYAMARYGKVEREFERYLATPIPTGLDFDRRKPDIAKRSKQRFEDWFGRKRELGGAMRKQYEAITRLGDGAVTIAAAARMGAVSQGFALQLFRAEIPADLRSGPYAEDTAQAYCDGLAEVAEPLETDAIASYEGCLVTSTKLGWFSEASRVCERELGQLQPEKYPQAFELRRTPDAYAAIVDVEGAPTL
ncbi:MAG TPA: tetratricopeptide repeat protein [Kofleriaceae bacterium]|nr:tetratricopeptide repeat protein [Kofleriaceae bacterium]